MIILVLNCGSSSIKFQVIETDKQESSANPNVCLVKGQAETLGADCKIKYEVPEQEAVKISVPAGSIEYCIETVLLWVFSDISGVERVNGYQDIDAVGHRVVHGGENFKQSTLINQTVIEAIEACAELAPLHNPANIQGIRHMTSLLGPQIPQVAVFDTAFHATMPEQAYMYGLPYEYYQRYKIRRYGFHGTSHRYIAHQYQALTGLSKKRINLISLHLGNGCSACAIRAGDSIDTSMGFTPLEGLLMGTRSGDIDPSILEYLHHREGMGFDQLDNMLNKQSGLLGVSGLTSDMRTLLKEESDNEDPRARLAIDIFCRRVCRYVASYYVGMQGKADALVFTAGIGENSASIRQRICTGLECLGVHLDEQLNSGEISESGSKISSLESAIDVYVIPTNEEGMIARDTARYIKTAEENESPE